MTWDSVPYFTGVDGAEHSPEVFRNALFVATGGAEGVTRPGDLKVLPLVVPGNQVRVSVGGFLALARAQGGDEQSYSARNYEVDLATVTQTGSSARRDLVAAVIEDPSLPGQGLDEPDDPARGPYVFTRIIPNVPAGTTRLQDVPGHEGDTGIALARLEIPANTAAITAAMIVDLRNLSRPRSLRTFYSGTTSDATTTLSTATWASFPPRPINGIAIPDWATHAAIRVDTTMRYISGDAYAKFQSFLGPLASDVGQQVTENMFSDAVIDSTTGAGSYRQPLVIPTSGLWRIPDGLRGKTGLSIAGRVKAINQSGGKIASPASDYYTADITWTEQVV